MIINSIAPCRICDIGGWTDTYFAKTGEVLNIAIYPYVKVQLIVEKRRKNKQQIVVYADSYGEQFGFDASEFINDKHALIRGAFKIMNIPDDLQISAHIHSDMPPGASTGTSAAVSVALIGAINQLKNHFSTYTIPLLAHRVETEILKIQCGIQDQLASTYGGINKISITNYPSYYNNQVSLFNDVWWELERRLMLVYLGHSHNSSDIHNEVIQKFTNNDTELTPKLNELRQLANDSVQFLEKGNFEDFADIMNKNTNIQRSLHKCIMSEDACKIETLAFDCNAIGVKLNGAGGNGGSVTILFGPDEYDKINFAKKLSNVVPMARIIPIYLSRRGLRVW